MSYYANNKRIKGLILKKGDRVYLNRKNIVTRRPNRKLDYKKLGPFRIIKQIYKDIYRLELLNTIS